MSEIPSSLPEGAEVFYGHELLSGEKLQLFCEGSPWINLGTIERGPGSKGGSKGGDKVIYHRPARPGQEERYVVADVSRNKVIILGRKTPPAPRSDTVQIDDGKQSRIDLEGTSDLERQQLKMVSRDQVQIDVKDGKVFVIARGTNSTIVASKAPSNAVIPSVDLMAQPMPKAVAAPQEPVRGWFAKVLGL